MNQDETVVWSKKDLEAYCNHLLAAEEVEEPLKFTKKNYKPRRSLSQNKLYWAWMDLVARVFTERSEEKTFNKNDMDFIFRHKFLGYEDLEYGRETKIPAQLRRVSLLDKGEMFGYMQAIDDWCQGLKKSILLPRPEGSEYDQILENQKGG